MASNYKYFVSNKISEFRDSLNESLDNEISMSDATPIRHKKTMPPYVVTLRNITTSQLTDVVVLGANQNLPSDVVNYGNSQAGLDITQPYAIVYSTGTSSVTYGELLYQTLNQPFTVEMIYLKGSTTGQALSPITLQHKESTGRLCQDVLVPLIDPNQNVASAIILKRKFTIDGDTSLTIKTFYSRATLNIYLFPSEQIDFRKRLNNEQVNFKINVPSVANLNPIVISEGALKIK